MYSLRTFNNHRPRLLGVVTHLLARRFIRSAGPPSTLPEPPPIAQLVTEQDNAKASDWIAEFAAPNMRIPRDLVELTFSRSSGPGGQVSRFFLLKFKLFFLTISTKKNEECKQGQYQSYFEVSCQFFLDSPLGFVCTGGRCDFPNRFCRSVFLT